MVEKEVEYATVDDVPEEYRKYLVDLEEIELLQEYELKYIVLQLTESYYGIRKCLGIIGEDKEVNIGAFIYSDKVRINYEVFHGMQENASSMETMNESLLIRESSNGTMEYKVFFYKDNVQYYVEGNINKSELIEIATEYWKIVCE